MEAMRAMKAGYVEGEYGGWHRDDTQPEEA
jgi:hypothetical protein